MADSEAEAEEKTRGAISKTGQNPLSRLSNSERAWVANAKLRATKLYDQTRAAARNPAAPQDEVADLSRRSARAYQDLRREWEEIAARCRDKDRKEAYAQAEPRWREVEDIFQTMPNDTECANFASILRLLLIGAISTQPCYVSTLCVDIALIIRVCKFAQI